MGRAFENAFLLRGCDGPACAPGQDSRQAPVHAGHGRGHADHRDHGLAVGADLRAHRASAGRVPVLLLVPAHPGAGDLRAVLDLLPAAADQEDREMSHVNAVALTILVASFLFVTLIGFASARWRPAEDPMHLNEWGLGGRGFGTFVSWFLLGGDIYTAYTFIAVPALVYATGAAGFYALSYTIMVFPIVFIFGPRLWSVARARGYVSPGEFARGRFGSQGLGLAVAQIGRAHV